MTSGMVPGGDSSQTVALRLLRQVKAALERAGRDRTKGMTNTPVANRGILILNDTGQLYIPLTDVVLRNLMGLGGADGFSIVFSDRFAAGDGDSDLLDAYEHASVLAGDIIVHGGRLYTKTTDGLETLDGECIINGSFENLDDSGNFEFWIRKA